MVLIVNWLYLVKLMYNQYYGVEILFMLQVSVSIRRFSIPQYRM